MNSFPETMKKYITQLWYIFLTPVLFFIIMGVYRPFENPAALDMGRSLFVFNVTMMMCIILVFLLISRTVYFLLRKYICNNWWQFIGWIVLELVAMTFFIALYLTLMSDDGSYFWHLALSCQYTFLILCVPYAGITAVITIVSLSNPVLRARDSIKFTDKSGQVKIVILKDAILYVKADENYVVINYVDGDKVKSYTLRTTMASLAPLAESFSLYRCQRSYYVNPSRIVALRKDPSDMYSAELDIPGIVIPVSRNRYSQLSRML